MQGKLFDSFEICVYKCRNSYNHAYNYSVIGTEFDEKLLQAIIPQNYLVSLSHSLDEMMHKGFI